VSRYLAWVANGVAEVEQHLATPSENRRRPNL
jgi:hypothetical protein